MMNFINSNAAGVCEEGLGAAAEFNICSLRFHSICKASAADQALCKVLYKHPTEISCPRHSAWSLNRTQDRKMYRRDKETPR